MDHDRCGRGIGRSASVIARMWFLDVLHWQFWHKGLLLWGGRVLNFDVGWIIEDILVAVPIHVVGLPWRPLDGARQCQLASSLHVQVPRGVQIRTRIWKRKETKLKKQALDFDIRVILSFCSPFLTLRSSLKIKSFTNQNMFYRSDIFLSFSISSL